MPNTNFDLKNSFFSDEEGDELENDGDTSKRDEADDVILIPKSKVILIKKLISNIKDNNDNLINILGSLVSSEDEARISIGQSGGFVNGDEAGGDSLRVVEGVFDGENMIGPDGKVYSVPANYASKSKLVEGDIMKLTISAKGTFVYKQIGPIDRSRIVGRLEKTADGNFFVVSEENRWRVLTASVTYFKGASGDEAVILIPKSGESRWAAIENIVHNQE